MDPRDENARAERSTEGAELLKVEVLRLEGDRCSR